jgi:hypothetical protein
MELICSSEMSVDIQRTTRLHSSEDRISQIILLFNESEGFVTTKPNIITFFLVIEKGGGGL